MDKILVKISAGIIMLLLSIIAWFLGQVNENQKETNRKIELNNKLQNETTLKVETNYIKSEGNFSLIDFKLQDHEQRISCIENKIKIK